MAYRRIACCTDFSENATLAFEQALELAEKYGAELHIVHVLPAEINPTVSGTVRVLPDNSERLLIPQLEEQMAAEYSPRVAGRVDCKLIVLNGHVSTEIVKYLQDNAIDLAVVGSYGLSGLGLVVFGSVAKRVSHRAPCSVLIVRNGAGSEGSDRSV